MERLTNCNFNPDIRIIECISGGNQEFEIIFYTKNKEKYKFIFNNVWDMRYSIENASIERFYQFRKHLKEGIKESSVYLVEDSEYIKYFEKQVSGTRPIDEIKHYIVSDEIDTILDILTVDEPQLEKCED